LRKPADLVVLAGAQPVDFGNGGGGLPCALREWSRGWQDRPGRGLSWWVWMPKRWSIHC